MISYAQPGAGGLQKQGSGYPASSATFRSCGCSCYRLAVLPSDHPLLPSKPGTRKRSTSQPQAANPKPKTLPKSPLEGLEPQKKKPGARLSEGMWIPYSSLLLLGGFSTKCSLRKCRREPFLTEKPPPTWARPPVAFGPGTKGTLQLFRLVQS